MKTLTAERPETMDRREALSLIQIQDTEAFSLDGKISRTECPGDFNYGIYRNDFFLEHEAPWLVSDQATTVPLQPREEERIVVAWEDVEEEEWVAEFHRLKNSIEGGDLDKAVPVLCEKGRILRGDPTQLTWDIGSANCGRFFLHADGDEGIVGVTPERLFSIRGNRLETAALAGTARLADSEKLQTSGKEMKEHRFVSEFIVRALEPFGLVECGLTGIRELGELAHLTTPISLEFHSDFDWRNRLNEVVAALHPTPAVGVAPRNDESMGYLRAMRDALDVPASFGAPVGYLSGDICEIFVAIRCLIWQGDRVFLPAGAGIVQESTAERELAELQLKRDSVKRILGLR
ncbi:MAG: chorismate-binding protein [Verrucomicrobiota bacterium]